MSDHLKLKTLEFVRNNKIKEAFKFAQDNNTLDKNLVILLENRYLELESKNTKGLLTNQEYSTQRINIVNSIIEGIENNEGGQLKKSKDKAPNKKVFLITICSILILAFILLFNLFNNKPALNIESENFNDNMVISENNAPITIVNNNKPDSTKLSISPLTKEKEDEKVIPETHQIHIEKKPNKIEAPKKTPIENSNYQGVTLEKLNFNDFMETISFFISNQENKGIILIDKISLIIDSIKPYNLTNFPIGFSIFQINGKYETYECDINISSKTKKINVSSVCFDTINLKYSPGEIDEFILKINSEKGYEYDMKIQVDYNDFKSLNKTKSLTTNSIRIDNPIFTSLDSIISEKDSVDWFLLGEYDALRFLRVKEKIGNHTIVEPETIFLSTYFDSRKDSGDRKILESEHLISYFSIRQIEEESQNSVKSIDSKLIPQYIKNVPKDFFIINNEILVLKIKDGVGKIVKDKEIVNKYKETFNLIYNLN